MLPDGNAGWGDQCRRRASPHVREHGVAGRVTLTTTSDPSAISCPGSSDPTSNPDVVTCSLTSPGFRPSSASVSTSITSTW